MYCSLSGKGIIRKWFVRVERFHRGQFLFGKQFEETAFSSEDAFEQRGSLPIQKTVHKTTILMWWTVAQRMISTRRSVEEEHSFDTEGCGGEGSFDMIGGSGEDEPGNKAFCFYS